MLSKLENIVKTMEGHLKSLFSHIRKEVEKTTARPLILVRCLEPKSYQDQEKGVPK